MKSAVPMVCVVATRPPTLTDEVGLKYTPFGLLRNTWPLAVMRPKIWLAWLSCTRFSVTEPLFGCWKLTWACDPTLKVCQSIAPRWVAWLIVIWLPPWVIVAAPPTTWPPVGNWLAPGGPAQAKGARPSPANSAAMKAPRPLLLPRPRTFSATATQAPCFSLQIRR